ALADWFAVVALFRHPLGLPIPHTAIIPERKNQFGETLGDFVQSSFLTPETITERVRNADVGTRLGTWLARPANADRVARHAVDAAVAAADLVKDEDVHRALEQFVRDRVEAVELAPLAGGALRMATAENRHRELVDAGIRGLERYLDRHREELHHRFGEQAPWWLPGAVEDRIFDRLLDGFRAVLTQMADDPNHSLRRELDLRISSLATELETSPELRARGEQVKRDLLEHPALRLWVISVWSDVKAQLRTQAEEKDSELRRRLADAVAAIGTHLAEDATLSGRVNEVVESAARYVAEQFSDEIGEIVTGTIARWDGEETAHRLELLLGPDLQFIRINGTVVGGMAGLALHTIAQFAR
ncbi:MAG TPA: DUF445 domain-containing protein, partial [Acidimicrobiales bacterium]|nr:DUF445 domain-containing protein [Acidimicrobiales bacterium]